MNSIIEDQEEKQRLEEFLKDSKHRDYRVHHELMYAPPKSTAKLFIKETGRYWNEASK